MVLCALCGNKLTQIESFKCDFCEQIFCSEHRLVENHNCVNAPNRTPLGYWKAKPEFDDYVVESKMLGITKVKSKKKQKLEKKQKTLTEKLKHIFKK
jgi:hypothetical protein